MVVVEDAWQLPHPPDRVLALLTSPGAVVDRFPGLDPPPGAGKPGRLRIQLGPAQATLAGRAQLHAVPSGVGIRTVRWELVGRRVRGSGGGRARVQASVLPDGGGALIRVRGEAELSGWDPDPGDAAVEAALRRLLGTARRALAHGLDALPAPDGHGGGDQLQPVEIVPPAPAITASGRVQAGGDKLRRLVRDRWPVGLFLVGTGTALAVWLGGPRRRRRR